MIRFQNILQYLAAIILMLSSILFSCQRVDDTPPVLILKGDTLVKHILNTEYQDEGASATDETDGNLTQNIFVENTVNVDRVDRYIITYRVVDEAGNEAVPLQRAVNVYNQAVSWNGAYSAFEEMIDGSSDTCSYMTTVNIDSTVNYRIVFYGFACNPEIAAYANISDTLLVMPYQEYQDSLIFMSIQGSGWIKDSSMYLEYQRKLNGITSYWNATFSK